MGSLVADRRETTVAFRVATRPLSTRRRLLMLGGLGAALTALAAAASLTCLLDVGAVTRELGVVQRAQSFHQDADMMHDALRGDVMRAQQVADAARAGAEGPALFSDARAVARQTRGHARQYRADIDAARSLPLPDVLVGELEQLRPLQLAYIASAENMVESALDGGRVSPLAREQYEAAWRGLVSSHALVTTDLTEASLHGERGVVDERRQAFGVVGLSSLGALAGWFSLVLWHNHSIGRLHGALRREAEQRSAADLLQRSLLPGSLPTVDGLRLAARSLPGDAGRHVGGDWYDVITMPDGQVGLVVGDVAGHDLPAATAMGQLRNALRAYAVEEVSPARVLARLNRLTTLLSTADMATCVFAVLDPMSGHVRWSSAGHLPPLVTLPTGLARLLPGEPGLPLGVFEDATYTDGDLLLPAGDSLLLYSDGLVERRGTLIDDGLAQLQAACGPHRGPDDLVDQVLAAMVGDGAHGDDVTLLVAQAARRPLP
jgi:hypothetical protein